MPDPDGRTPRTFHIEVPTGPRPLRARPLSARPVAGASAVAGAVASAAAPADAGRPGRVTTTVPIAEGALRDVLAARVDGLTHVYRTLEGLRADLTRFFPKVRPLLPESIHGRILQPNGMAAHGIRVQGLRPSYGADEQIGAVAWEVPDTVTDARGAFRLDMPRVPRPAQGLVLSLIGRGATSRLTLKSTDLVGSGALGVLVADIPLSPLEEDLFDKLKVRVPALVDEVDAHPEDFVDPPPVMKLGEGECARAFQSNAGVVDRYRYGVLIRLVEPQLGQREVAYVQKRQGKRIKLSNPLMSMVRDSFGPDAVLAALGDAGDGDFSFEDRVPIDRPVDVTEFHDAVEADPRAVPKASTLGLGYIVKMRQTWLPRGLSLGDLVYSLPLAPGEEQRIAVFEQNERLAVREAEAAASTEAQRYGQRVDSSTDAIFQSAYREAAAGGSSFSSHSESSAVGGGAGVGGFFGVLFGVGVAGGHSSSSSSGSSNTWQRGSRDFVSSASEDFHHQLSRQASASKRASRTGIRLASASEREEITTKIIANRNHSHALTIQYWEVLRHYAVQSEVDDVQLVAYVPMELIPWLPEGQPRELASGANYARDGLLDRYELVLRYADVLRRRLRREPEHRIGLRVLEEFAADPTMTVQSASDAVQDVVRVTVNGTFLPFDDVSVTVVTRSGGRIGPYRFTGEPLPIDDSLRTREQVLQHLDDLRNGSTGKTYQVDIPLPGHIARNDVIRFDVQRRVRSYSYDSDLGQPADFAELLGWLRIVQALSDPFRSGELEQKVGGPFVWDISAKIQGGTETFVDAYSGPAARVAMGTRLPVPSERLPPTLRFGDLLKIEALFQHVVRNGVGYSQAVWRSLSPGERAIMLERFTIGMPEGGLSDAGQEVPLLNCVANVVLGYFGNSMVMPFHIPPQVAEATKMTSRDVQEALMQFHREGFTRARTAITLPTDGVLGEAVLGSCNASEKIDLTRFWNWKDSPIEAASTTESQKLGSSQLLGNVTGPNSLAEQLGKSLLDKLLAGDGPTATALAKLIDKAPTPTAFGDLTGKTELSAQIVKNTEAAQAGLKTVVDQAGSLAGKAMDQAAGIAKEAQKNKLEQQKSAETKASEAKAAEAKKAAETKAAEAKKAAETKDAAQKKHSGAVSFLTANAGTVSEFIKKSGGDHAATATALVTELFGGQPSLSVSERIALYKALSAQGVDATGAGALTTALGLPTGA